MKTKLLVLIPVSLMGSGAALAQGAAAPAAQEPQTIVVEGARPGTGLVVDVERIALNCAACRRALAALQASSAGARARIRSNNSAMCTESENAGQVASRMADRDRGTYNSYVELDKVGGDSPLAVRGRATANRQRVIARDSAAATQPVARASAGYLQNLMRLVNPIVARHRQERKVAGVYAPQSPEARGRNFADITDLVISELDRDHRAADLLDGIPIDRTQRRAESGGPAPSLMNHYFGGGC
jgi:hypothetical protein